MENGQYGHKSHDHELTFYGDSEEKLNKIAKLSEEEIRAPLCYGCSETIHGPAYLCDSCGDFWLHKACFELPSELPMHSLHNSTHPLTLIVRPSSLAGFFVCDGCRDMSPGFAFHCRECRFNLDVKCALSTDGEDLRSRKGVKNTEPYFGDDHELVSFNAMQEVGKTCTGCQLLLSGPAYGCLECEFYLHKSCKDMPSKIQHPYHEHPLLAQVAEYGSECDACHMPIRKIFYRCSKCDFNLHILCANKSLQVASSLKHKCHEHDLYYFVASHFYEYSLCNTCRKVCKSSYYLCLECRFYVHLDCIPLPRVVENDSHSSEYSHSLTLKDCFVEDDSGQYYCNACEKERNPTYDVYYCDQCPNRNPYVAHIECLMSELKEAELRASAKMVEDASMENIRKQSEGDENGETKCLAIVKYTGPEDQTEDRSGLPPTKTHSLHLQQQHPLTKFQPGDFYFICDGCRDLCHHVAGYRCNDCRFFLDMKCASLPDDQCEKLKKTESKTTYFCHKHELTRANCAKGIDEKCKVCQSPISGATYCCINCKFFLHESCVEKPKEIQHVYHLKDHPLLGLDFDGDPKNCRACNLQIWNLAYYCGICDFALHFTCAAYLTSTLKHEFHEHTLFSFVVWDLGDQGFIQSLEAQPSKGKFRCEACNNDCRYSFYRCVECNINGHLDCIPVPLKVQQDDHHSDPLTLMEKVIEDDKGEYYCEICQKKRNPNHPVYCCKMCEDNPFIAHIGCVLIEGDPLLEILENSNKDLGSDSEGSKVDDETSLASHSELESYAREELNTAALELLNLIETLGELPTVE